MIEDLKLHFTIMRPGKFKTKKKNKTKQNKTKQQQKQQILKTKFNCYWVPKRLMQTQHKLGVLCQYRARGACFGGGKGGGGGVKLER